MAVPRSSSMHIFSLPPPALAEQSDANITTTTGVRGKKRRVALTQQPATATGITLPPPPTRTRKIIQMNPPSSSSQASSTTSSTSTTSPTKSKPPAKSTTKAAAATSKVPPANSTSRKVARKTAHSLIERRRRSKMNAEFEVLKNLVPACTGVEMHKLAILQASIEYVRYLEGCVKELQKATGAPSCPQPPVFSLRNDDGEGEGEEEEEEDMDMDMETQAQEHERIRQEQRRRQSQISEYSNNSNYNTNPSSPEYATAHSAATSPLFTVSGAHAVRLPSISPLLFPQPQPQHYSPLEATAGALLLLADEGRRDDVWRARGLSMGTGRGISVRDLLSS